MHQHAAVGAAAAVYCIVLQPDVADVVLTCTNGVSPDHFHVIAVSHRPRTTLSTRAR